MGQRGMFRRGDPKGRRALLLPSRHYSFAGLARLQSCRASSGLQLLSTRFYFHGRAFVWTQSFNFHSAGKVTRLVLIPPHSHRCVPCYCSDSAGRSAGRDVRRPRIQRQAVASGCQAVDEHLQNAAPPPRAMERPQGGVHLEGRGVSPGQAPGRGMLSPSNLILR